MTTIQCVLILSAPVPVPKRVCVKSDSRISSQGWWVSRVAVRNLWPLAVDESFLLSSSRNAHSNWTYTVLNWWVLRDIGEKWCEECYNIPVINDLTELNEHLAVEIQPSARVYPSGRHATAIPIVIMCVDNNGLKTMTKRTCIRLDFPLQKKGKK